MNNRISSVWVALLGVVVGVLLCMVWNRTVEMRGKKPLSVGDGDWRKVNLVLESLDKEYVDSIDHTKITEAAIDAALGALDPHSIYIPPVTMGEVTEELQGNFDGIGIQFNVPNDTAIVLEVIPGGPSEKIGLQPGDRILKVDDIPIAGVKYPQDSMVRHMKGPAGTKVLITVGREGDVIPFEITRGKIPMHSVDAAFMVNDTTGYLRLGKFALTTYTEVSTRSKELLALGMKRLILDLRDNTGGYFDQALLLANLFLPRKSSIVYIEGLHCPREEYNANGRGLLQDIAIDLLVDEGSASSSEIVAGAIQDNDRGTLYGRRTFGKGLVQKTVNFSDGSGLRLTMARYYTPSGRCIQKPYNGKKDYEYYIYDRYADGEMLSADSIKVDSSKVFKTKGGRTVFGGGGIIPDVFVPVDTTRASSFYMACNRKATSMRFASAWFDGHRAELQQIDDFGKLKKYLDGAGLESAFLAFASSKDGLKPASQAEWAAERKYMMTQVNALVGRYSKLGEDAFYHLYLATDNVFQAAMKE